ncbi:L-ribulokinase [Pillotina sp. SPG140]|jgi:L-ribulokinase
MSGSKGFVLGLDYGSDSARAVLIDAADGNEVGSAVKYYSRWSQGLYCDPAKHQFRHHPKDYCEALEQTVREALKKAGPAVAPAVKGIAIDTTGSTPCAIDAQGMPLALNEDYAENPNAMFILWKDHTAVAEAAAINDVARTWGGIDYTKYEGGVYSSEWFWAKIMHTFAIDPKVAEASASFAEHCDWMSALLTGVRDCRAIKRSRCAMGHKAMYHANWGYPAEAFFARLDQRLLKIKRSLGNTTWTSDSSAGPLSPEWAERLGLPVGIPVAVGAYDAHMGAVGGGVKPGWLVRVMGTSTCDIIVGPKTPAGQEEVPVRGICGQVDGSVIPGMLGYEAGQSSFGDVYAWFKKLLMWPLETVLSTVKGSESFVAEIAERLIPELEKKAETIDPQESGIIALDWLNGRRTPNADHRLTAAVSGLNLGTDSPRFYKALVDATAYGARAIVECFREQGVAIEGIIGIGGVAHKSSLVMQTLADVLNMPINVPGSDQVVALGAAIFAATAAGLYPDMLSAQQALCSPIEKTYMPRPDRAKVYDSLYEGYKKLGAFVESHKSYSILNCN